MRAAISGFSICARFRPSSSRACTMDWRSTQITWQPAAASSQASEPRPAVQSKMRGRSPFLTPTALKMGACKLRPAPEEVSISAGDAQTPCPRTKSGSMPMPGNTRTCRRPSASRSSDSKVDAAARRVEPSTRRAAASTLSASSGVRAGITPPPAERLPSNWLRPVVSQNGRGWCGGPSGYGRARGRPV